VFAISISDQFNEKFTFKRGRPLEKIKIL